MSLMIYIYIGLIITMISLIYFIINDRDFLDLSILIEDLAEATIIGGAWIISIPILVISNIIITIIYMIGTEE